MRLLLLPVSKAYHKYHRRLPGHLTNQSFETLGGEPVPMPGTATQTAGYSVREVVYK